MDDGAAGGLAGAGRGDGGDVLAGGQPVAYGLGVLGFWQLLIGHAVQERGYVRVGWFGFEPGHRAPWRQVGESDGREDTADPAKVKPVAVCLLGQAIFCSRPVGAGVAVDRQISTAGHFEFIDSKIGSHRAAAGQCQCPVWAVDDAFQFAQGRAAS